VLEGSFGQRRQVDLRPGSFGFFDPLVTDRLLISFPVGEQPEGTRVLPVGVGELRLKGLRGLKYTPDPQSPTGEPCGLGPDLVVDDQVRPTRIAGTLGDVAIGTPLTMVACGRPLRLPAGTHELTLRSTERFAPTSAFLASQTDTAVRAGSATSPPSQRTVQVQEWGSTTRAVDVGPGEEALLRVPENINEGWRATLDGAELSAAPVDGWQQGWMLPAGEGGVVRLEFSPGRTYHAALLAGLVCALVLVAGAVASIAQRRDRARATVIPLSAAATGSVTLPRRWGLVGLAGAAALLGGAGLVVGCLAGVFLREAARRWAGAVLAALTTTAAAVATATEHTDVVEALDILAAIAVGLLITCLVERRTSA
jgi:arabinofuranan 3-O-arabinosyltransferase